MASSKSHALPEGTEIDSGKHRYRIVGVLGAGGFGITYKASTPLRVSNVVLTGFFAIKEHFVSSDCERDATTSRVLCSNPARERVENSRKDFISEARRLHRVGIDHPNIVRVNEVFEANDTAYYVMEYLHGESLRSYVRSHGPLSEDEMLAIMQPVIDAVGCLHSARMTHLDVKPDNIMLAADENGHIRPVLIDFGLSKHYDSNGRPTSTINTLGCSDGYAPVEQYTGITTFSPTADIYALGATMLFCLTGRDPKKSSEIRPGEINATLDSLNVSDHAREIISRAMTTSQFDRTQSIPEMSGGTAAAGTPTASLSSAHVKIPKPPKPTVRPTEPIARRRQRSRSPFIIGGAIMAAIVAAVAAFFLLGNVTKEYDDFDIMCVRNGHTYFFSEEELKYIDMSAYHKIGVVLDDFVVELNDRTSHDGSPEMNLSEASMLFGAILPTREQAEVMVKYGDRLNNSIRNAGGVPLVSELDKGDLWYWTKTDYSSGSQYIASIYFNKIGTASTAYDALCRVRGVMDIEDAKHMPMPSEACAPAEETCAPAEEGPAEAPAAK